MGLKLKCTQCGNERDFMVKLVQNVVVRINDRTPEDFGDYDIVDHEGGEPRLPLSDAYMCMHCSRRESLVGDTKGAVHVKWVETDCNGLRVLCKSCGADAVDAVGCCTECGHRVGFCLDCNERLDKDGNCQTIQCISYIENQTVPRCPECDDSLEGVRECDCGAYAGTAS